MIGPDGTLGSAVLDSDRLRHVVFRSPPPARPAAPDARARSALSARQSVAAASAPLSPSLSDFYERLFARSNLRADRYRETVLRRREGACLRALGVRDVTSASALLDRDPAAVQRALQAVAIGVTSFFRDPMVFESLERPLREIAPTRPRGVRVLSVGCSDGRELYSMALLLDALAIPSAALDGVDCRESAVRSASVGIYPTAELEAIPATWRGDAFTPAGRLRPDVAQVRAEVRARCRWRVADAFALAASGDYDVVLCRNLLIYLVPDAAAELWLRLRGMLAPGGVLVVGKAERPPSDAPLHRLAPCVYQQRKPAR